FTSYWMSWVSQRPGKGLEWVGRIYPGNSDTKYSPAIQGHVTISTYNSINTAYLRWSSLKAEDTATYSCARDTARKLQRAQTRTSCAAWPPEGAW
uniref:Immunoglobulin V-set domain-containing protein n=1 Tax=Otolemur garnettii TaxID=30611 RepID=H0XSC0_OTOGA